MTTNEHPPRVCSSWFTYLPTYLLTNLPANLRIQSPRPVHRCTLLFVCVLLLAISSPPVSLSLSSPPLVSSTSFVYLPLFLSSRRSPFPPLLRFTALGDRDHAARALPSLCPLCSAARDAALLTDTLGLLTTVHSASSRRCVSCIVSPHRATPRHATALPVPASTSHNSQRVASYESSESAR